MKQDNQKQNDRTASTEQDPLLNNAVKDPDNWSTGNEQMTGAQLSYLQTLSQEAGIEVDENLTKAEASKKIDELQQKTGRGIDH